MCGFAAFFEPERQFSPELLAGAGRDLFHRGPDSGGTCSESGIGLIFRRLAIIDLSEKADQPMTDPSGQYTIVFNGEIYNQKDLRQRLEKRGVTFMTHCDTEVILHGYIVFGEKIFDLLEGMYALVIVDRKENIALAARDPYGIKPLYMHHHGNCTAFASEMRVLTRIVAPEVDHEALGELLVFGWAAGTRSNLKNIDKVQGGTLCRVDLKDGQVVNRRFSDLTDLFALDEQILPNDFEDAVLDALENSLSDHLMSDVGYALQLSGGVDSSLIGAMSSLKTTWQVSSFSVDLGSSIQRENLPKGSC